MYAIVRQTDPLPSKFALGGKDFGLVEGATHPAFIGCSVTYGKAMSNDDTPLPLPSPGLDPSITIDSQEQAWQRLITRAVPRDDLPSVIETILSGRKSDVADRLREGDAQAFIEIMDEVRHHAHYFRGTYFSSFCVLSFRH